MPLKSVNNIKLDSNGQKEAQREMPIISVHINDVTCRSKLPKDIQKRYEFSNYVIDPNKHRFCVVVRIMALATSSFIVLKKKAL